MAQKVMIANKREHSVKEWFQLMDVGDVVKFPLDEYDPSTVRSTPRGQLLKEIREGKLWKTTTTADIDHVVVTRVS